MSLQAIIPGTAPPVQSLGASPLDGPDPDDVIEVVPETFCPDRETSGFYAKRAAVEGWTRAVLQTMIASRLHERSQRSVLDVNREAVRELVKDPFILDFLTADPVRERDLSRALNGNLSRFLRELGAGWAFFGAEVPVQCAATVTQTARELELAAVLAGTGP